MIIVSVQCLGNPETYEQALRKCAQFKTISERNVCRMNVTKRYKNVPTIEIKQRPRFRYKTIILEDFEWENEDER